MWGELKSIFDKAGADAALRCILIRGDGDEAFSAGADIHGPLFSFQVCTI